MFRNTGENTACIYLRYLQRVAMWKIIHSMTFPLTTTYHYKNGQEYVNTITTIQILHVPKCYCTLYFILPKWLQLHQQTRNGQNVQNSMLRRSSMSNSTLLWMFFLVIVCTIVIHKCLLRHSSHSTAQYHTPMAWKFPWILLVQSACCSLLHYPLLESLAS
jgi:hypothetical protein